MTRGDQGSSSKPRSGATRPASVALFWAAVAAAAIVGVFILPLRFPPQTPTVSVSYTVGFNNKVAAIAAALISLGSTLFLWWRGRGLKVREPAGGAVRPMPGWWLALASLVAVVLIAVVGGLVVRDDIFYPDASYFIDRLLRGVQDHARLYTGFEFAYGPVLYYWSALFVEALGRLGVGLEAAYMASLAAMQVVGVAVVFYILGKLPLSRAVRAVALATATLGTLSPVLGVNYTFFRFGLAYAAVLWIAERKTVLEQALWTVAAEVVMVAISLDTGVAFAAGMAMYGIYRAATGEKRWIVTALAPWVGAAIFLLWDGAGSFALAARFARGVTNLPVEPRLHIDVLLIGALALAPLAVAGYARRYGSGAAPIVGMYGASLAMLPSALGRCDGLHIFFCGFGIMLLSLLAIPSLDGIWPKVWLGMFVLLAVVSSEGQSGDFYRFAPSAVRQQQIDVTALEEITRGGKIAAPLGMPPTAQRELTRNGQFAPSFFCGLMDTWDLSGEEIKLAEIRRVPYVLLPRSDYKLRGTPRNDLPRRLLRLGYRYKEIHAPFVGGALIEAEMREHWTPVAAFGEYELYRQR